MDGKEGVMGGRVARPGIYDAGREVLGMAFLVWSGCGVVVLGRRGKGGGVVVLGRRSERRRRCSITILKRAERRKKEN